MKRAWVRSAIFNTLFWIWSFLLCLIYIPAIILPRRLFMGLVHFYLYGVEFLELHVFGLRLEVRGMEHLPKDGSYIVAAKHQSPYETLKLHLIFKDPAVILKKELLRIPLWGMYLAKADVIAIDRSTPDTAIQSIQTGALRMKEQGRPIIIFPQGTRVWPNQTPREKPYKVGVARIQEATDLPIIPMAMNAGMYWPRSGWGKTPGTVVFEFLEPIMPGKNRSELLAHIEKVVEEKSNVLMEEARTIQKKKKSGLLACVVVFTVFAGIYSAIWFEIKSKILDFYLHFPAHNDEVVRTVDSAAMDGYPFFMRLRSAQDSLSDARGRIDVSALEVVTPALPLPFLPIDFKADDLEVKDVAWSEALTFENAKATATYDGRMIKITDGLLKDGDFEGEFEGIVDPTQNPPEIDMVLRLKNYTAFVETLVRKKIIAEKMQVWAIAGLGAFDKNGYAEIPLKQKQGILYAGPFPVYQIASKHRISGEPIRRQQTVPDPVHP